MAAATCTSLGLGHVINPVGMVSQKAPPKMVQLIACKMVQGIVPPKMVQLTAHEMA